MSSPVLLDTNALIFSVEGDSRIGFRSRDIIDTALGEDVLLLATVSFWEIAMLAMRGRINLAYPLGEWRQTALKFGIREIPLTGNIGIRAAELDGLPGDPTDRMITAAAMAQGATLITADSSLFAVVRTGVLTSKACRGTIPPWGKIEAGIRNSLPMPARCDVLPNLNSGAP